MAVFEVKARHTVPLMTLQRGRAFDDAALDELRRLPDFEMRGCYIFSIDYPTGSKPAYVGKTQDQTLGSRTFSADNRLRVQNFLNNHERAYHLSVWLLAQRNAVGAPNISDIDHIESWLIYKARERNSDLLNKKKVGNIVIAQKLQIAYLLNSVAPGRPPQLVVDFKHMMGLH